MPPGKAGGLFGERLGSCSRRCSRQLLLHCSTFAHPWARTSCIHAVVKGADNTVIRLKAADFLLLPPSRGNVGMGGKCVSLCPPFTLRPPPSPSPFQGEGNTFLRPSHRACPRESGGQTSVSPPAEPGGYLCELSTARIITVAVGFCVPLSPSALFARRQLIR